MALPLLLNQIIKGKKYWICNESASKGKEVFQYSFEENEEPHWDWAVFKTRKEAIAWTKKLK